LVCYVIARPTHARVPHMSLVCASEAVADIIAIVVASIIALVVASRSPFAR
jgi:hypothetical protein